MTYGMFIADRFGQYEDGYTYGWLALELNRKFEHAELECKLNELFPTFLMFYRRPLRETLEYLDRAYQAGLSLGDFTYLSYTTAMTVIHKMSLGDNLGELSVEIDRHLVLMQRTKEAFATAVHSVEIDRHLVLMQRTKEAFATAVHQATRRGIESLTDPRGRDGLRDDSAEERVFRDAIGKRGLEMAASWY